MEDHRILQESPEKKQEWLRDAGERLPVGTRVRVVASDEDKYMGLHGEVIGYDLGVSGEWPMVRVRLEDGRVDSFYCDGYVDDEVVAL